MTFSEAFATVLVRLGILPDMRNLMRALNELAEYDRRESQS